MKYTTLLDSRLAGIVWLVSAALLIGGCAVSRLPHSTAPATAQPAQQTVLAAAATPVAMPPAVLAFTANPTATLGVGDAITVQWQAVGDRADLCMISGPGPVDCQAVALTGQQTVTVTDAMLSYSGIGVRATAGEQFTWGLADLRFACQAGAWFFADPPERCPEAAPVMSAAAYQPFELGFMIWTQTPDRFYVFFDHGDRAGQFLFADAPYDFLPEQPITETPPSGLSAPVSGFSRLWRNGLSWWRDTDMRGQLGWATAPEVAYDAVRQCALPSYPGMWTCYLQTPDGRVLVARPDSTAQVHFVWEWQ